MGCSHRLSVDFTMAFTSFALCCSQSSRHQQPSASLHRFNVAVCADEVVAMLDTVRQLSTVMWAKQPTNGPLMPTDLLSSSFGHNVNSSKLEMRTCISEHVLSKTRLRQGNAVYHKQSVDVALLCHGSHQFAVLTKFAYCFVF